MFLFSCTRKRTDRLNVFVDDDSQVLFLHNVTRYVTRNTEPAACQKDAFLTHHFKAELELLVILLRAVVGDPNHHVVLISIEVHSVEVE